MNDLAPAHSSPSPPPLPLKPWERLADFSDKLSPMLVKELRQGLRTHTFVILFLVLQGFLALILLTTAAADVSAGTFISGIIFCFFSLAVLVIQPLRGMSAISSEIKSDTIDLMVLTRLTAWRITFGKWASIMGQSLLILCTIIPYLILRYFFGEMQLFSELLLLFCIFLLSGTFTALTVGVSGCPMSLVRILPLLGGLILMFPIFGFAFTRFDALLELTTPQKLRHWIAIIGFVLLCIYVGYFFLELGTSFIAPAAENRATLKRLIAALIIVSSFVSLIFVESDVAWVIAMLLLALITLDVFTENPDFPSIVTRPFLRYGFLGKIAGRFLYPGWATGLIFHAALFGLILLLGFLFDEKLQVSEEYWELTGIIFGALQFPLIFINIFQKYVVRRFSSYLIITTMLCLLFPLFMLLEEIGSGNMTMFFSFIPHVQPWLAFEEDPKASFSLTIIWGSALLYFFCNLAYSMRHLKPLTNLEKQAAALDLTDKETNG